jgi:hypothetical protein
VNVTWTPCSFPSGHPAGAPAGSVVRFLLVPLGPVTKIRNVFPRFTVPKVNNASIRFGFNTTNRVADTTLFALPLSTANTLVTFADPSGNKKHAPVINVSCGTAQSPSDGDSEITTGALTPRSIEHVVVSVNNPNRLLSPLVNVVVVTRFATPPQHANGNAVPGSCGARAANVPLTRFLLTGVTDDNAIVRSGTPSLFVSHTRFCPVVTVLPGRCNGTPVSDENP